MKQKVLLILTLVSMLMLIGSAVKPQTEKIEISSTDSIKNEVGDKTVMELMETLPEKYIEVKLFEKKWGTGDDELGYIPGDGACGPQGIALDTLGNIYVLDYCNGSVKKFDANGKFLENYSNDTFFANLHYMEVSKDGEIIYGVSENNNNKFLYNYYTKTKKIVVKYQGSNYSFKIIPNGVAVYKNGIKIDDSDENIKINGDVIVDKMQSKLNEKINGSKYIFKTDEISIAQTFDSNYKKETSFLVFFLSKDRSNNYYILKNYSNIDHYKPSVSVIYKFTDKGKLLSIIPLEIKGLYYLNYSIIDCIRISAEGDIYYICPKQDKFTIYKYICK